VRRQRVFFFSQAPGVGGGERAVMPLLPRLTDIELLVVGHEPVTAYARELGLRSVTLELPLAQRLRHGLRIVPGSARVHRLFRRTESDVFYSNGTRAIPYAVGAALLGSRPLIFHHHGVLGRGPVRALSHAVDRFADAIIVPSGSAAEPFGAIGKIRIVANGVDLERFRPRTDAAKSRRCLGLAADTFVVGTLTRPAPTKGMDEFLGLTRRAAGTLPNVQFLLAGGPVFPVERELYGAIAERATALGVRVTGYIDDTTPAYQAMDVFVHLGGPEGFSLTVLEALACGVPVVAYDWGAIPEVFAGLVTLVRPGDIDAAADAVAALAGDTQRREDYARRGRLAAQARFGIDETAEQLRRVIASIGAPQ